MKILFDENIPRPLKQFFPEHEVTTVQEAGWSGFENGELLDQAEGKFDVFILADKNLRYQQNLSKRTISIIELPTNRWPILRQIAQRIVNALSTLQSGTYLVIDD